MGWKSLEIDTAALLSSTEESMRLQMVYLGTRMVAYTRQLVSHGGSGRVYVRKGRSHQASSPGEPPASTGPLRDSIMSEVEVTDTRVTLRVGTNLKRGLYLEMGTRKMAARPFLRPTLAAVTFS